LISPIKCTQAIRNFSNQKKKKTMPQTLHTDTYLYLLSLALALSIHNKLQYQQHSLPKNRARSLINTRKDGWKNKSRRPPAPNLNGSPRLGDNLRCNRGLPCGSEAVVSVTVSRGGRVFDTPSRLSVTTHRWSGSVRGQKRTIQVAPPLRIYMDHPVWGVEISDLVGKERDVQDGDMCVMDFIMTCHTHSGFWKSVYDLFKRRF
jgi:hypothetical protein